MSSMFTSLLPFLKALQRQDMPSPEDGDGSNPQADQLDNAGSAAPSEEGVGAAAQSNAVGNSVPGTAQRPARTPARQPSQDTKGDQLMRLLRSGFNPSPPTPGGPGAAQGSNPNPLQALAPLAQSNAAPPLGVMPDGTLVQDMGYLQNAPSRIPQAGPDVTPNLNVSDPNQTRATLNQLVQGIGGQAPPLGVLPDGTLVQDMGYLQNTPSRIPQGPDVPPNLNVSDPNQTRATLNQLVQGMGDQTPPFGVLPDGTLYRDMGYLQHAPSKIFPPAPAAATTGGGTRGRARGQNVTFATQMQQPVQTQQTIRAALANNIGIIDAAADKYNIPRDLFESLIYQESRGNPHARSPKGAMGLAQLMPGTAAGLKDPYDPQQNVERAAQFLGQQLRVNGGNAYLALQAYNAGPQRLLEENGVVNNAETRDYARRILGYQAALQQDPNSPQAVDPDQVLHDQAQAAIPIMQGRAPEVQRAQAQKAARQAKRKGAAQPSPTPTPHP
jgi:hypothetical protein